MSVFAREAAPAQRLVRLFHAAAIDGTLVRARLTVAFADEVPRYAAEEIADRAAARTRRILEGAARAADLAQCEPEVISSVRAGLGAQRADVRGLDLELSLDGQGISGTRLRVLAETTATTVDTGSRAGRARIATRAQAVARCLTEGLLRKHEAILGWDEPTAKVPSVSAEQASQLLSRLRPAAPALVAGEPRGDELDRWRATYGADVMGRVQQEAAAAAMFLVYEALSSPARPGGPPPSGAAATATNALVAALATDTFPDLHVAKELPHYLYDPSTPVQVTLASRAARLLNAPSHIVEIADALVWLVAGAREDLREAVTQY